jgi:hypothetical protein
LHWEFREFFAIVPTAFCWNTGHTEGSAIQDILFEADRRALGGYKNATGYVDKVEYISTEWTERGGRQGDRVRDIGYDGGVLGVGGA